MSKNPSIVLTEKLDHLADEIKATFTERISNARDEVIRAHHETGKAMHDFMRGQKDLKITALVQLLAERGAGKERTLWDCYKFFEKFPKYGDVDKLGHGKNISWNKIKAALEPAKAEVAIRKVAAFEVEASEWEAVKSLDGRIGDEINIEAIGGTVRLTIV